MPFTIKPVIYGSLACGLVNTKCIATITGLGTVFIKDNWITKVAKRLYALSLKFVEVVFFQNNSDKELFINNRLITNSQSRLVPGSGIDTSVFVSEEEPSYHQTKFLLIARMLKDKGIEEFVAAAKGIKALYPHVVFQLLGPLGVENRTSISDSKVKEWQAEGAVEYLGESADVRPFIQKASCIVLPSYREGLSRVLLEASSMSRPIIASDVPGCREVIDDGITGFLCKVKNTKDLEEKMLTFMSLQSEQREDMGKEGRKKIKEEFDIAIVIQDYLTEIRHFL